MSFITGRVTCCKFLVSGDAPKTVDETLLSILKDGAFRESDIGAPDDVEAGFITGHHLLDVDFTYEKCGYGAGGNVLLFALRLDTHKVPADVKHAIRKQHELAAAASNPSGFASKAQKRDAREATDRQLHDDLAAGKFRRSKIVPLLWNLTTRELWCGATSQVAHDQLLRLMREAFGLEVQYASPGITACRILTETGRSRDYEDLLPTPFTAPPAGQEEQTLPIVPWIAKSIDLKDFLGNELLTWMWWHIEEHEGEFEIDGHACYFVVDRVLDMDCAWDVNGRQTLRGNGPTRLTEAVDALVTGKWPRKVGLIASNGEQQWEFTLQGDRMAISGLKLPPVEQPDRPRDVIEERLVNTMRLIVMMDGLFRTFIAERTSKRWPATRKKIKDWIAEKTPSLVGAK